MQIVNKIKNNLKNTVFAGAVLAQETGTIKLEPKAGSKFLVLKDITVGGIVSAAIQAFLVIAAIVAFFFLIIGGIKWITSGGDKGQVESARNTITAALIGLLIVFVTFAIIKLVFYFFGVDLLDLQLQKVVG